MGSASTSGWKSLPITNDNHIQDSKLFFTLQRHEKGVKLQVTDLIHIWTAAKTSREELKEEAARTRCSIDPSEDEEQYEVLVTKLEEAVSKKSGGRITVVRDGTASSLTSFEIEASVPLPKPLGMLEWTFRMIREKPSVFTQEVVVPAFCAVEARRRREEDLRRKIKEKDHVIGKLMDKIEGSGIDLSMVFPGFARARKGLSARQAAKVVPGLEPFREDEWEGKSSAGDDAGVSQIVDALRDSETGELEWKAPSDFIECSNDNDRYRDGKFGLDKGSEQMKLQPLNVLAASDDDSDSSQTAERRGGALRRSSSSSSSPGPVRSRETSSRPRPPKLGPLGGIKSRPVPISKQTSVSVSPEPLAKASKKLSPASTKTATESDTVSESGQSSPHPKQASPKKPTSKLGIIGGRKPQNSTREPTKSPELADRSISQSTPSKAKSRLGAIGGKKNKAASPPTQGHDSTASPTPSSPPLPTADQPAKEPSPGGKRSVSSSKAEEPLTEAERANQKRLELKRQLDQGAGKKKKRKF